MNRTARVILATGVALAVLVPTVGGSASAAPLETTSESTITVRSGDSLAGLAWRHGVRLSALLRANSLELTSVIHPGDTLVIPAGGSAPSAPPVAPAAPATAPSPSAAATGSAAGAYVVQAGDALFSIAWRHGVRLGALLEANGISVTSVIMPGQRLQIPPATRPIPATASTPSAAPSGGGAAPASTPVATPAPASAPPATAGQSSSLQTLLSYLTAQVGAPYRFFSAGPDAFDCSGLVVAAFRQIGMSVPHQSRALAKLGTGVDWRNESIAAGDLVFTSATNDPAMITHVGVALDSQRWVHAVGFGRTVSIGSFPSDSKIMAVQRLALP